MANPSPICEVKDGAGAYQATTDGVDVTPGNTITIHLATTAGVDTWSIECIGTDELSDAATVTAALTINQVTKQATFTAPVAGRAYLFQSRVNGGVDLNGVAQSSYTTTFKIATLTSGLGGLRVGAFGETTENDSAFGSAVITNAAIRALESEATSLQSQIDALVLGGTTDATTSVKYTETIAIGDVLCSAQDAADATKVRRATAANLATGALVMGIALQAGINGDTKLMARDGCILAASVLGLGTSATDTTVVLNTTTALANSTTTPAPTQRILGKKDTQGNVTIKIVHPGIGTWIDNLSMVSPLDYGVVADGSTDAVAAMTNAMNDAISLGKRLISPAGTVYFASTFTFSSSLVGLDIIGKIKPASGVTVTIACPYTAPDRQVFTNALTGPTGTSNAGHGKIVITGQGSPLKPVHWGAAQDAIQWTAGANGLQATAGSTTVTSIQSLFTSAMVGRIITIAGGANACYAMTNRDSGVSLRSGSTTGVAQSFAAVRGDQLQSVRLMLKKTGSPTGNATVKIYAHSGVFGTSSVPTGTAIAQATTNVAALTTSYVETTITFSYANGGQPKLTEGTNYLVAIEYSGGSVGNTLDVGTDASSPGHAGNFATYNGSWSADLTQDLCFVVDNRARHVTTVAGYSSATSITVTVAPTCTAANALGWVGSDDTDMWESALAASKSAGNASSRMVHGTPQTVSMITSGLLTGVRGKLAGNFCKLVAGASFDRGMLTKNDLAATNSNSSDDYHGEIVLDGNGLAGRGVEFAKDGVVSGYGGVGGPLAAQNISVLGVTEWGFDLEGCQSTTFRACLVQAGAGGGFRVVGCNGTAFFKCVANNVLGGDGWDLDGQSDIGSGGCQLFGCQAETCNGYGFRFRQSHTAAPITLKSGWSEGNAKSAYYIDRDQVGIEDITFAGGGGNLDGGTYYPFHIATGRKLVRVRNCNVGGFTNMWLQVDTGCSALDVEKNYITTLGTLLPVVWADSSKLAHTDRFFTQDWQTTLAVGGTNARSGFKGSVGVNSPTPREALDVWSGSARVGDGNAVLDNGDVATKHGGLGRLENLFAESDDLSNSTAWNSGRGADTVVTRSFVDPFDGETYQILSAITGTAATNRFIWQQPNIYTLKGYSSVHGKRWRWQIDGLKSAPWGHDASTNVDASQALYSGAVTKLAQSFVAETGATITKAQFRARKRGAPTGNVTAAIYAHSGTMGTSSVPTGAALATSSNVDITTLAQSDECGLAASNRDGWSPVGNGTITGVAQSFTERGSQAIERFEAQLKKTGAPTGNAVAKLYAHTGTLGTSSTPTGAALATSDNLDVSTVSGSEATYAFKFSGANKIQLSAGTNYCIAIEYSGGGVSDYLEVGHDATPANTAPYGSGNLSTYNGAWSADSGKDITGTIVHDFEPVTFSFPSTSQALLVVDTNYCLSVEFSGGSSTAYLEIATDATDQSTTFTAATSDIITPAATVPHLSKCQVSSTVTLPAGLSAATDYWAFHVSTAGTNDVVKLAATLADAINGTPAVDITSTGSGTHTITFRPPGNAATYNGSWSAASGVDVPHWMQPHGSVCRAVMSASNGSLFLTGADITATDRPESAYVVGTATGTTNNQSPLLRTSLTTGTGNAKFKIAFKRVGLAELFPGEAAAAGVVPKTSTTGRTAAAGVGGLAINRPAYLPGGQFTLSAAATTTVSDKRVGTSTRVICFPANLAAATLVLGTKSPYHDDTANVDGTSFAIKTQDGTAAAGTERFTYILVEPWTN